ncbi:MAG: DNA-protecting protein DprA [Actinomycetota bacterium]|jgi:DNA processing protein
MTTTWNLSDTDIDRAMVPLRPDGDEADRRDAFADVAWGFLTEPGDRVAGALIRRWGATDSLARILTRPAASTLAGDDLSGTDVAEALARWEPRMDAPALFRSLSTAVSVGAKVVRPTDSVWPAGLVDLGDHGPRVVWCRGDIVALPQPSSSVAIVGARASTGYGEHVAMDFAAGLTSRGFAVVSGGAYGIDGMAHRATLACGGSTVAVLAGGIDQLYPAGHDELLRRIIASGVVISEVSPGGAPTRWRFLQRNRLIAAMAGATVVIEAGYRSGSLNTATHARDLDRPIGVVPGPVTSGASAGCHRLLRTNPATTLVTTVADVVEFFGIDANGERCDARDSDNVVRILDSLSSTKSRTVETIAAKAGIETATVTATLGTLEAEGRAARNPAGWIRKQVS